MAPTTIIETVTVTRPLKVLSFLCGVAVFIFTLVAVTANDWVIMEGARMGLFVFCVNNSTTLTVPDDFVDTNNVKEECTDARESFYIRGVSILCVICFLTNALATLLTGLGLKSEDAKYKYKFYRLSVLVMIVALVSLLAALVLYPWKFDEEFPNFEGWGMGWAYIMSWVAFVFLTLGLLLLLCDKESEEIFYKERKIVHENGNAAD